MKWEICEQEECTCTNIFAFEYLGWAIDIMYCNKFLRMCLFLQEVIALTSDLVQLNEVCVAVVLLAF